MKRSSSALHAVRSALSDYFELFLTTAGVLLAIAMVYAELSRGEQGLALIFLVWLQGLILWSVHRHGWYSRRSLVKRLRLMLQDRVNTQLTVLLGATEVPSREMTPLAREELERAVGAAHTISLELENLSLKSVRMWEQGRGRFLPFGLG